MLAMTGTKPTVTRKIGVNMTRIELLANEIALLSNDSLQQLAHELVKHYAPRADVFEANLSAEFFYDKQGEITNV